MSHRLRGLAPCSLLLHLLGWYLQVGHTLDQQW